MTILENLKTPLLSDEAQGGFERIIRKSYSNREEANKLYVQAETFLLSELGLINWLPQSRRSFVKSFSDLTRVGRVDADYFQPKYHEVIAAFKSYPGGWDVLGNLARLKDTSFMLVDTAEYKYIELANIAGNGEIAGCMVATGEHLPSRARRRISSGDVIVSSIEGSLDSIALIGPEYDQAICSTGFHVINSTSINSETLLVLLKSMVGQLQLKKGCSGTILTAINKDALNQIVLPLVSKETQDEIQHLIANSSTLRQQSKRLLECAKRAVEIAIEQDEQTAIAWLGSESTTQS